ncbi:hypothetical protein HB370_00230 [Streptomyces sp. DSM 40868]|uniref:hypothetical protein n=1 Tax=Streptomyces sp. DSM 40868 TaxID=2721173 RepID=UPI00142F25AA|nr:hypothetical protein [Streptomyces sp. DSM 40868]QIS68664.1 hypothetical protein HB370_00230 [Streptomyces sp. DSM 40868]
MSGQTTPGTGAGRYRPGPVAALGERLRDSGACVLTGEPGGGGSTILARVARAAGPAVVVPALPERCRQPLACLRAPCRAAGVPADDADLWDAASRTALGRLAARLSPGDGVSLVLTVAGHRPVNPEFAGLPLLRLAPLSTADTAALLDDAAPGALDPRARDEITAAAEGNPGLLLGVVHRLRGRLRRVRRRRPGRAVDDPAVPLTTGRIRDTRPVVARPASTTCPAPCTSRTASYHRCTPSARGAVARPSCSSTECEAWTTGRRALFRVPPFHVRPAAAPSSLSSSCAVTAPTPLTPPSVTALSLSARPSPRPARSPPQSRAAPSCCATPASVVPYVDAVAAGNCCSRRERPGC